MADRSSPPRRSPPSVLAVSAAFALVLALAFGLRLAGTSALRPENGLTRTPSADAHYYLKRTVDTWRAWPGLPQRDPGLRCPRGTSPPWPHGLNLLAAGAARLLLGPGASPAGVERVAAWLPPVIGALACGLLALFGVVALGLRAGLAAGMIAAALPIAVWNSAWGVLDHHVFAGIFPLAGVAGLWAGWRQRRIERPAPPPWRDGFALSGAAMGVGYAFWTEMWLHHAVLLCVALLWATGRGGEGGRRRALLAGIARWSLAAGLSSLPGILSAPYMAAGWVAPHAPSRFTLWVVLGLALAPAAAWVGFRRWGGRRVVLIAAVCAGLAVAGVSLLVDAGMRGAVRAAFAFAGQGGVVGVIDESRPLLARPFPQPLMLLTPAIVLTPLLPAAWGDRPPALRALLGLWFWCSLPLALLQTRFALVFALPYCLGLGSLIADGLPAALVPPTWGRSLRALAAVLTCGGLLAVFGHGYWTAEQESRDRLMRWLRAELPYRAGPHGEARCTLAPWDLGHELLRVAGRPVVAHPFTESRDREAIATLARFLTAASPRAALAAMAPVEPVELVWISGMDLEDLRACFAEVGAEVPPPAGLLATTWARLWLADGSAVDVAGEGGGASLSGYGFLRRIRTSPLVVSQALPGLVERPVHRDKVYQRVRGARLVGRTRPGALVRATIRVAHPGARPFDFAQTARAAADGRFSLRVPYATSGMPFGLRASPRYTLSVDGERRFRARVRERDVALGGAVTVTDIYADRP